MPKTIKITSNKKNTKAKISEKTGLALIRDFLEKYYNNIKLYKENDIFNETLEFNEKGETEDGYFEIITDNNKIRVYLQSKANQSSCRIDKRDRSIIEHCGFYNTGFVYFFPNIKEKKVYFKILSFDEFNNSSLKKIRKDKSKYLSDSKTSNFLEEWKETVNKIINARKRIYDTLNNDRNLVESIKYDESTDKIEPVFRSLISTRPDTSEANRVLDLNDKINRLGKEPWTRDLLDAIKNNPTLQSRFFQILQDKDKRFLEKAVKFILPKLIEMYSLTNESIARKDDWENAKMRCLLILNKYLNYSKTNKVINQFYFDRFKEISSLEFNRFFDYLLYGLEKINTINQDLWAEILTALDKTPIGLHNFCLTTFATKQFSKYPDQSTQILLKIVNSQAYKNSYNALHDKYFFDEFFKKLSEEDKVKSKGNLIKLVKKCLILSYQETKPVSIEEDLILKTHYIPFPHHYIYPIQQRSDLEDFSYFDLLWELLELNEKNQNLKLFEEWLKPSTLPESIVFFIYRFSKKKKIKYPKIDELIEKLEKNKHFQERRIVNINNWLDEKSEARIMRGGIVTDKESIEDWQEKNLEHRKDYLKWKSEDWKKDIEFETNEEEDLNYNSFHFVYDFTKVLKEFLKKNTKTSIQDLIQLFGEHDYQNEDVKYNYQLACVNALEEQELPKEKIIQIYLENIQNQNLPLKKEIAKHFFWFIEKQFTSIKDNSEIVEKAKNETIKFLENYELEPEYHDVNNQKIVTVGTIINIPNGVAIQFLITKLWSHYLEKDEKDKSKEIKEFVENQFNQNKPVDRDVILCSLGYSSNQVLNKNWDDVVENFLNQTLSQKYDYGTFFFVIYLINRWIKKAENHQKELSEWIRKFFKDYQSDGRDDYQEACIYEIYAIEICLGIFGNQFKTVFGSPNSDLKKQLSWVIIETAEVYRKYFKEFKEKEKNYLELEKRLETYLQLAVGFLSENTDENQNLTQHVSQFLRPIIYYYKDLKEIEDYFDYWLSKDKKEVFGKIINLEPTYTLSCNQPQFLKMEFLEESKKLRNQVIDFFEEYLRVKGISEAHVIANRASEIIFIVKKDQLESDNRVKFISDKLIEENTRPQVIELAEMTL